MSEFQIVHADSEQALKTLPDGCVDVIITDPPYALVSGSYKGDGKHTGGFMGKKWDSQIPALGLWQEVYRVLKPSGYAFVMSAPRADVYSRMILRLHDAGLDVDRSGLYWTFFSGFPKASNMGKMIDKRLGVKSIDLGQSPNWRESKRDREKNGSMEVRGENAGRITIATSPQAKVLDGSHAGYQPKPAWEAIIVAQKPPVTQEIFDTSALSEQMQRVFPFMLVPKAAKKEKNAGCEEIGGCTHPTVKPMKLMSALVLISTGEGGFVLDPFVGSGTTVCSAVTNNRNAIGIDLDEGHVEIANARARHWSTLDLD